MHLLKQRLHRHYEQELSQQNQRNLLLLNDLHPIAIPTIIANIIFMPMLVKLEGYTAYEVIYRGLVVVGLRNIARGESPRNIQDQMVSALPPKMQAKLETA